MRVVVAGRPVAPLAGGYTFELQLDAVTPAAVSSIGGGSTITLAGRGMASAGAADAAIGVTFEVAAVDPNVQVLGLHTMPSTLEVQEIELSVANFRRPSQIVTVAAVSGTFVLDHGGGARTTPMQKFKPSSFLFLREF